MTRKWLSFWYGQEGEQSEHPKGMVIQSFQKVNHTEKSRNESNFESPEMIVIYTLEMKENPSFENDSFPYN